MGGCPLRSGGRCRVRTPRGGPMLRCRGRDTLPEAQGCVAMPPADVRTASTHEVSEHRDGLPLAGRHGMYCLATPDACSPTNRPRKIAQGTGFKSAWAGHKRFWLRRTDRPNGPQRKRSDVWSPSRRLTLVGIADHPLATLQPEPRSLVERWTDGAVMSLPSEPRCPET